MLALLALVITITVPGPSDVSTIAALAYGEACGMPRAAQELIIANLLYDAAERGTDWLPRRWYARPRYDAGVEVLVWSVVERLRQGERWPRCRLLGSKRDAAYWREHGYVEGEPDYQWSILDGRYQIVAFDCALQAVEVWSTWGCVGVRCPQ